MTTVYDGEQIRAALVSGPHVERLDVFSRIDSTNSFLKDQLAPAQGKIAVAIADHQTAGRGRHNRKWISAPGKSLCLSIAYTFANARNDFAALTLALGTAVAELLADIGTVGIELKWPNDLVIDGRKLGGILTEAQYRGTGGVSVVVGIGINMQPPPVSEAMISAWASEAVDLDSVVDESPTRSKVAEKLIDALFDAFRQFESDGFSAFATRFRNFDVLNGKHVIVDTPDGKVTGEAIGTDDRGALLVKTSSGTRSIITGSIMRIDGAGK